MSTTNTFTAYIKSQLIKLGYDDLARGTVSWNVGCESSGNITFERNTLHLTDAEILCERLMNGEEKAAVKRVLSKGISVEVGGNYNAEMYEYDYADVTEFEMSAFDNFICKIDDDIAGLKRRFITEGRAYFDATPDREDKVLAIERNLGRFRLVINKVHAEFFDLFDWEEEEEADTATMKGIISGEIKFFDLEFDLYDRFDEEGKNDGRVACGYISACSLHEKESINSVYRVNILDTLREMVDEARTLMGRRIHKRDALADAKRESFQQQLNRAKEEAEAEKLAQQLLEAAAAKRLAEQAERAAKRRAKENEFRIWSGIELA